MGFGRNDNEPQLAHELLTEADQSVQAAMERCAKVELSGSDSLSPARIRMMARLELAAELIRESRVTAMALELRDS